jgi:hypothetical protein
LVRDHLWLWVCTTMSLLSAIWFPQRLVSPAILCFYSCRQCFTCQPHSSPCGVTKRLHSHSLHSHPKETAQDPAPQTVILHLLLLFSGWIIPLAMHACMLCRTALLANDTVLHAPHRIMAGFPILHKPLSHLHLSDSP